MWFLLAALVVFLVSAVTDEIWVQILDAVTKRRAFVAGLWSGALDTVAAIGTYGYINDERMVVPYVLGGIVGTTTAVQRLIRKDKRNGTPDAGRSDED